MDYSYRGYLIRVTLLGQMWIERNGKLVSWVLSAHDAKRTIDALLD